MSCAAAASIDDELVDLNGHRVMRGGVPLRRADAHFEAVRATFNSFGLLHKEQPPLR